MQVKWYGQVGYITGVPSIWILEVGAFTVEDKNWFTMSMTWKLLIYKWDISLLSTTMIWWYVGKHCKKRKEKTFSIKIQSRKRKWQKGTSLVQILRKISPNAQSWYNRKTGLSSIGTRIGTITNSSNNKPISTGMTKIWNLKMTTVKNVKWQ